MKKICNILPKIKERLIKLYGDRLIEVILYGSFATNTYNDESDIDIAVVLKGKVNKVKEIDKIYDVLYTLMLETGEVISANPISQEELKNSVWPLFYSIKKEGVKI